MLPGLEAPPGCWVGAERDGPLFSGIPWPSLATFYLATLAISAALRARGITGRGQHVATSIMQGVLCSTLGGWQRVEKPDSPHFQTWVIDPRAPKGFFRCSDGRWTHHWVPLPGFVLGASTGDHLEIAPGVESPRRSGTRISTDAEDMVLLHHYTPLMAEAVARFSSDEWVELAGEIGVPVQPVRAPEEALLDPLLVADGCVGEVVDPQIGAVRQVGQVYRLAACPNQLGRAAGRDRRAHRRGAVGRHSPGSRRRPRAGPASGRTARRHRRSRPRLGRRRSLRHPAAWPTWGPP